MDFEKVKQNSWECIFFQIVIILWADIMWKNGFKKDFIKLELLLTKVWMIYWKSFTVITYLITEKIRIFKKN